MKKAIIVYGNANNNTENLVGYLCRAVRKAGVCDVTIKKVTETDVSELYDYNRILLASSFYSDYELQDDFIDFYEEMKGIDLKGKKAAAFGTGNNSMSCFCSVNTILEDRLKKCGADIITEFEVEEELYDLKINIYMVF